MERLEAYGVTIFRTDEAGTIVVTSDGRQINFDTQPSLEGGSRRTNNGLNKNIELKS